jgi:two-component system nitrogen regulation sensor histidine kinase NtrY
MKLRTKYLLFVIILHLVTLGLTFIIFRDNKLLFLVAEVFVLISIWISWRLYQQLIQPLKMLSEGVEAIKDRDFNVKFRPTGKYEMDLLISVYNEMIDQLRQERVKQEQQHFFLEKLIHTSPTGIIILDFNDHIHQVNPAALALLGMSLEELRGHPVKGFSHPLLQQVALLESGAASTVSLTGMATYKLQKSHFIDRGFARHFIMIAELTTAILAAEKNVYGKVIRMMAHEVNNTIGPVNSIIQTTLGTSVLWADDRQQVLKEALEVAIARNENLNVFMRNFADLVKLPVPVRKQMDLHQLIYHVTRLMQMKAMERQVQFVYDMPAVAFPVMIDEQQMEQACINIVKNAIEAIEGAGTVTFSTDPLTRQFTIADNGKGIMEVHNEYIFSPFFSTKRDGQGIGLTLVREILMNHDLVFSLETVAPGNTLFKIRF